MFLTEQILNHNQMNWVITTNSNLLIPLSLQPDSENL